MVAISPSSYCEQSQLLIVKKLLLLSLIPNNQLMNALNGWCEVQSMFYEVHHRMDRALISNKDTMYPLMLTMCSMW